MRSDRGASAVEYALMVAVIVASLVVLAKMDVIMFVFDHHAYCLQHEQDRPRPAKYLRECTGSTGTAP